MKTTKLFFMAALALLMTACSSTDEELVKKPAQPDKAEGITITAKLAPKSGGAATRAVADNGDDKITATWAEHEHIAILYTVGSEKKVADAEITGVDGSGVATIEFSVDGSTVDNTACTLVYPLSAAKDDNSGVKDAATLLAAQDGTLNANLDVRVGAGTIGIATPSLDVTTQPAPQFAIFKFTIQDASPPPTPISVNSLTVFIGTQKYVITPGSATSELYAALPAVSSQTVVFSAAGSDSKNYFFAKDGVTFAASTYYQSPLTMTQGTHLTALTANYEVQDGETLTGTLTANVKISIADGAMVTLDGVNITNLGDNCNWAGINCPGDATIILKGDNTVCAGRDDDKFNRYPGIWIAPSKTLTIQGDGSLTAYSNASYPFGAGIGGGYQIDCGNITISGGTVTANGGYNAAGIGSGYLSSCGDITISGGTVTANSGGDGAGIGSGCSSSCDDITISGGTVEATGDFQGAGIGSGCESRCGNIIISGGTVEATGGDDGAGIGSGSKSICGDITITSGVTRVTATKGDYAPNSIGKGYGYEATCGTVKIDGVVGAKTVSPYTYQP